MNTGRSYTHPLDGVVGEPAAQAGVNRVWVAAALGLALVLGLAVLAGGSLAYRYYRLARVAKESLEAAKGGVVYEPLSKVGDGSYEEAAGGGGAGKAKALNVLRRLRDRRSR